jgi:hypothetical protein
MGPEPEVGADPARRSRFPPRTRRSVALAPTGWRGWKGDVGGSGSSTTINAPDILNAAIFRLPPDVPD